MGHAAGPKLTSNNDVVPELFRTFFPGWFAGFAFSAIAIGALVPAAVMSIGAANLFTRNFWKVWVDPAVTPAGKAKVAKITSMLMKVGALVAILFMPTQFALDLQLLGGLWILQTLPSLVFGFYTRWFSAGPLLVGWAIGMIGGSWLAWSDGLKPLHGIDLGSGPVAIYTGLLALVLNVAVAFVVNLLLGQSARTRLAKLRRENGCRRRSRRPPVPCIGGVAAECCEE